MAINLLSEILTGCVGLDLFNKWITGEEVQEIHNTLDRTEFVLHVLNCIQDGANRFVPVPSSTNAQTKTKDNGNAQGNVSPKKTPEIATEQQENEFQQRTPFQTINKITPTKTNKQPFSRYLNNGNETRRDIFNCSGNQESKNILTSTPVHSKRNNSGHNAFPISPTRTGSSNSFHSDHSSSLFSPRSSSHGSGGKLNFSGSSHQSSSSVFSPSSPQYHDSFPDLGARSRHRTPHSPSLADFITAKPISQKRHKRIKPTKLISPADKSEPEGPRSGNNSFGEVNRPFVVLQPQPFSNLSKPPPESVIFPKPNFEEERNLLKQKRNESLSGATPTTISPSNVVNLEVLTQESEKVLLKQSPFSNDSPEASGVTLLLRKTPCLTKSPETSGIATLTSQAITVEVDPHPEMATNVHSIINLATVYSACLDKNLVPNILSELSLIFTLLTATYTTKANVVGNSGKDEVNNDATKPSSGNEQSNFTLQELSLEEKTLLMGIDSASCVETPVKSTKKEEPNRVLCSVHNCVMFAAVVIEKQFHLVESLDRVIIKLLAENPRLVLFVPSLIPRLVQTLKSKESRETSNSSVKKPLVMANGPVLYHTETDSSDNFSSFMNFSLFKKQRDKFYEILHEWRTSNNDSTWTDKRFPLKVQNVLNICSDPVNMMHFARLFCTQLTSSLGGESVNDLEIPGVTKDKLSRLQARFSKPQELSGGPRPPPQFPAEQQFYQHFLQFAAGSGFLVHVTDCLLQRLNTLDSQDFFTDGLSMEESQAEVESCVSGCCLLAKFLGLIVFSPYRASTPPTNNTLQAQCSIRHLVVPPVDVMFYLQRALKANRLMVTVPWVVAYLGMMDPAAPFLPCYRTHPLHLLVSIYRASPLPHLSPLASLLLRISLGWLFDPVFFPEAVFFSLAFNSAQLINRSPESSGVDMKDLVSQSLLLELCPGLSHLRLLLSTGSNIKRGTARHITPVPVQLTPSTHASVAQTLELQLEESFLNGQAASFRATLDFVVDRLSSSCIKHICSNVIATCKEQASTAINEKKEEIKKMTKKQVQVFVTERCQETEALIETAMADHCGQKIESVLTLLLGPDANNPAVFFTACSICARRCRDRIVVWLNSHTNLADMFSKLLPSSQDAKPSSSDDSTLRPLQDRKLMEHSDSVTSPPEMLIVLQDTLCQYIENRDLVLREEEVLKLISSAQDTLKLRSDLIPAAERSIFRITVDLCIVLLAYWPELVTATVLQQVCVLWQHCVSRGGPGPLERVMSARNVLLLCQAGGEQARLSWTCLSTLLMLLIKENLITPSQLEAQCVALYRLDWPPMVLTLMGSCITSTLEKIKQDPLCNSNQKFELMLEWFNEMTKDLVNDDIPEEVQDH